MSHSPAAAKEIIMAAREESQSKAVFHSELSTRECAYLRYAVSKLLGSQQGCAAHFSLHSTNIHHREK